MSIHRKFVPFAAFALFALAVPFWGVAHQVSAVQISTPINLTNDAASETVPSVAVSGTGDVVVSWQKNLAPNKYPQEIYARVALGGGSFGAAVNVSNDATPSRDAFLFPADQSNVYMLFRDTLGGTGYDVMDSVWNGTSWSKPTRLTRHEFPDSIDPTGVQATDGSIWFSRQVFEGGTWTDTIVTQIGGQSYNVSNDGSAVIRPAIVAGDGGTVYVAWVDHANERRPVTPGIHVVEWNGTTWTALPVPTKEAAAQFPRLAYHSGHLYLVWRSVNPVWAIKEAVWDGTTWSKNQTIASKNGITYPRLAVPASGNVFIAWEVGGGIYLKENTNTPLLVSPGVPNSHQPALFVDGSDTAHMAFENGDIWYVRISFP